jgi:catalase
MDDPQRERLVSNVAGALIGIKRREVLARALEYWRNIDTTIGDRIQEATKASSRVARLVGASRKIPR